MQQKISTPPPPVQAPQPVAPLSVGPEMSALIASMKANDDKESRLQKQAQSMAMQPATNAMGAVGNALGGYASGYNQLEQQRAAQRAAAGVNDPSSWLTTLMKG